MIDDQPNQPNQPNQLRQKVNKDSTSPARVSDELIQKIKKVLIKSQDPNLSKISENLEKLAISQNLITFLNELFAENEANDKIKSIILILIYKFNFSFFSEFENLNFDELTYMKNQVKQILTINLPSTKSTSSQEFSLNLTIALIFLLIMKYKNSLANYQFIEEIFKIKSTLSDNKNILLITEFLRLFLSLTNSEDYKKNLDFIFNFTLIIKTFFSSLDKNESSSDFALKNFKDEIHFSGKEISPFSKSKLIKDSSFVTFPRHEELHNKICEIYSFNKEQKLLFFGGYSSGKTSFAKLFTKDEIIIDLDENLEVHNLLGGYLINEFSEILWQDGLLLKALKEGNDVIFRNMEKCGNDLFFILKQIIEKNSFFLQQEEIKFSKMPKLIFIYNHKNGMMTDISEITNDLNFNFLVSHLFPINFDSYTENEKIEICLNSSPLLKTTNEKLNILNDILACYNEVTKKYKFSSRFREINLSDLINFSNRIEKFLFSLVSETNSNSNNADNNSSLENSISFVSEKNKMKIISTFLYMSFFSLEDSNIILQVASDFAQKFNFDVKTYSNYLVNINEMFLNSQKENTNNFIFDFNNQRIYFDDLTRQQNESLTSSNGAVYSYNNLSKFYMKLFNESVINRENVLLVGETGVGKTTTIQNLAKVMNTKLNVINMSQSSDINELFGGFKPIHPKVFLQKYFEKIVNIITKHFKGSNNKNFIDSFYDAYNNKDTEYFIKFTLRSVQKIEEKLGVFQNEKNETNLGEKKNTENETNLGGIKNTENETNLKNNKNHQNEKNLQNEEKTNFTKIKDELQIIKEELNKLSKAFKRGCYNAFSYIDGILLAALKNDEWILLDEINLAPDDLLLKLCPILEGEDVFVIENNELKVFKRGPKFRIFGSMNPEYNVGKKRLPKNLRDNFTEVFVGEIKDFHDIKFFVKTYLPEVEDKYLTEITKFYKFIKEKQTDNLILKQNSSKCNFSLRNLSRALKSVKRGLKFYDIHTAINEALQMNFLSLLNLASITLIIREFPSIFPKSKSKVTNNNANLNSNLNVTQNPNIINNYVNYNGYYFNKSYSNPELIDKDIESKFILTKTFTDHLNNLMRIITLSDYAVLLEGPTSVGKTSIVEFLGKKIGQKVVRINNNQNTEIEEYIGNYTTDSKGGFYFQEGFLVSAVQEGAWIILDEINLAPSEVLEALNRLLDDNRELFIPELNKTVVAHPNFKIFAAMNPSESYGGRKDLSEAFKNRFIHLYFDNIPEADLEEIVEKRCKLANSRVKVMVGIFNDLQQIRSTEKVFAKKEGFITIRDLIKWGQRGINTYEDLAYEGYFVIAEKIRTPEEKVVIRKIIEKNVMKYSKGLKLNFEAYYDAYVTKMLRSSENDMNYMNDMNDGNKTFEKNFVNEENKTFENNFTNAESKTFQKNFVNEENKTASKNFMNEENKTTTEMNQYSVNNLCLNKSMKRMLCLIDKCIKNKEPVLLIGETGTGKTIVCDYLAKVYSKKLTTINCHENIDTSDFIGSLRSVYGREEKYNTMKTILTDIFSKVENTNYTNYTTTNEFLIKYNEVYKDNFENLLNNNSQVEKAVKFVNKYRNKIDDIIPSNEIEKLNLIFNESHKLFDWVDGPLTVSMKKGDFLLIDEIALAQDSVLERMNSVFEADRVLVISEKQSQGVEVIIPREDFMIVASMNPPGDHGKRELSPALRSRFSEIFINPTGGDDMERLKDFATKVNSKFEKKEMNENLINTDDICNFYETNDIMALIKFKIERNDILNLKLGDKAICILVAAVYDLFVWYNYYIIKTSSQAQVVKTLTLRDVDCIVEFFVENLKNEKSEEIISQNNISKMKILPYEKEMNEEKFTSIYPNKSSSFKLISLYFHAINMTLIDGIFLNESSRPEALIKLKEKISHFLNYQIQGITKSLSNGNIDTNLINESHSLVTVLKGSLTDNSSHFGLAPLFLLNKQPSSKNVKFVFSSENISQNLLKILRGLTSLKPILIEGSPGVGKTTILQNVARKIGKTIHRINLSEHTDMIDLIGSDYPSDGMSSFKWVDGVFLKAMMQGDWLIIDEMNLASQSVLEGLNSVLDHRRSLFVSELNKEFKAHQDFQIFATQNPVHQGGGRKFLPQSFLNRFVKVYLNDLDECDYNTILKNLFRNVEESVVGNLTKFNRGCVKLVYEKYKLNMNEVGEFNLRTLTKVLETLTNKESNIIENTNFENSSNSEINSKIENISNAEINTSLNFNSNLGNNSKSSYISNSENNSNVNHFSNQDINMSSSHLLNIETEEIFKVVKLLYISRIRRKEVRKEVAKLFREVFNYEKNIIPKYDETNGETNTNNSQNNNNHNSTENLENKICSKLPYIENWSKTIPTSIITKYKTRLSLCIANNFPIIIAGKSGIGKKEAIRQIAKETNNDIFDFTLNSSMDSTELLGNFDKINLNYHLNTVKEKVCKLISLSKTTFESDGVVYLQLLNLLDFISKKMKNSNDTTEESISLFTEKITALNLTDYFSEDIRNINKILSLLKNDNFNFEWHDSTLVKCIVNGHWIILDNVNTCSAAVLDRLNSLLDDDKSIFLNECGDSQGRVVQPHPNFRIFLVMNERFGEVSRALKNRCVEVYFDSEKLNLENISEKINLENISEKEFNIDKSDFSLNYEGKNLIISVNNLTKRINISTFDDLIRLSEDTLFDFRTCFKLVVFYLLFVCGNNRVNLRQFKKFVSLFNFYFNRKRESHHEKFIHAMIDTFVLMSVNCVKGFSEDNNNNSFNDDKYKVINSVLKQIEEYFNTKVDFAPKEIMDKVNSTILHFRYKMNVNLGISNSCLLDHFFVFSGYYTKFNKELNSILTSAYNKKGHSIFLDEDNAIYSTQSEKEISLFTNLMLETEKDKTLTSKNTLASLISLKGDQEKSVELIKSYIEQVKIDNKYLTYFSDNYLVNLIFSFILSEQIGAQNEIVTNLFPEMNHLVNSKKSQMNNQNIYKLFYEFCLSKIDLKNLDKSVKKLVSSNWESQIDELFSQIKQMVNLEGNMTNLSIVNSFIDFFEKEKTGDNYNTMVNFLQANPETFIFVINCLIEKLSNPLNQFNQINPKPSIKNNPALSDKSLTYKKLYKKLKLLLNKNDKNSIQSTFTKLLTFQFSSLNENDLIFSYDLTPEPNSKLIITPKSIPNTLNISNTLNAKVFLNFSREDWGEIINKILLSNSPSSNFSLALKFSPLLSMFNLDFDNKSALSCSCVVTMKHFHHFIEKVALTITSEKITIPIVVSINDMTNLRVFIDNLIAFSSYSRDFLQVVNFLESSREDSSDSLIKSLFLCKKMNIKDSLSNDVVHFFLVNRNSTLVKDLVKLVLIEDYSDVRQKTLTISNDLEVLVKHMQSDYKKLFNVPIYYFFASGMSETFKDNAKSVLKLKQNKFKIQQWEKVVNNLICFVTGENTKKSVESNLEMNKIQRLENLIKDALMITKLTVPDKVTVSKILGKDLFVVFYETLVNNLEKSLLAEHLINRNENRIDQLVNDYTTFTNKMKKFESDCYRGGANSYDRFIRDLADTVTKVLSISETDLEENENMKIIDEIKVMVMNMVNKHILNFGDIITPFVTSLLVFVNSVKTLRELKNKTYKNNEENKTSLTIIDQSLKSEETNSNTALTKNSEITNTLLLNTLYRLPSSKSNLETVKQIALIKLTQSDHTINKPENNQEFIVKENDEINSDINSIKIKLTKHEDLNMKVLENTNALDELSKTERDKIRQEEENKEIEENFPLYTADFANFDKLDLINLTKNIHIDDFYDRSKGKEEKKASDANNTSTNSEIDAYSLFRVIEKHLTLPHNSVSLSNTFNNLFSLNKFYTIKHIEMSNKNNSELNLDTKIENIIENQFFFNKVKIINESNNQNETSDYTNNNGNKNSNNKDGTKNNNLNPLSENLDKIDNHKHMTNSAKSNLNFYKDPQPKEMSLLYILLNKFLSKISSYLTDFPDHPLLIHILIIIFNLLQSDVNSTPLSKVVTGLDVLLQRLQEWESYASKKINSFQEEMKLLMTLIRRFRKLEITSWRGLIGHKSEDFERKDCEAYFKGIFIAISNTQQVDEVVQILNMYIQNSTLATFVHRVNSLKIVSSLIESNSMLSKNSEMINSINNIYNYYRINFLDNSKFENYKNATLADIEAKVKNLMHIAKWDIKNYFNFRDNMKRNYKQLNKILKSFDAFCLTNTREFLQASNSEGVGKDFVFALSGLCENKNNLNFNNNLNNNLSNSQLTIYEDVITSIYSRIENLKAVQTNKVFKHKALIDLIKTLKSLGFNSVYKFYQEEVYTTFKGFNLDFVNKYDKYNLNAKTKVYIVKILERISNFNVLSQIHEDLNLKYLDTMKGLCFSSYFKCLKIYQDYEKLIKCYDSLVKLSKFRMCQNKNTNFDFRKLNLVSDTVRNVINSLVVSNYHLIEGGDNKQFADLLTNLGKVNDNYHEFIHFLNVSELNLGDEKIICLGGEDKVILFNFLERIKTILNKEITPRLDDKYILIRHNVRNYIKQFNKLNDEIENIDINEEIENIENINENEMLVDDQNLIPIKTNTNCKTDNKSETKSNYDIKQSYIEYFINEIIQKHEDQEITNSPNFNLDKFMIDDESNDELSNAEMEEIKDIEAPTNNHQIEEETAKIDELIDTLEKAGLFFSNILTENSNSNSNIITLTRSLNKTIKDASILIHSVLKLTNLITSIFFNVSHNGFCQPNKAEKESEGQSGGVHEGGFGMAEGEGVEDVSKEIEDEEQLLGLKEDKVQDEKNEEKKEEKDDKGGFEMTTDFKEDQRREMSDDENEENEKDKPEEEDIERENDDVENGKDNKMYDEDNEIDDEKEKEEKKEDKGKVDLTDKSVSMDKQKAKDNNYKAKEEASKGKDRSVDKPEENQDNEENNEDENQENENIEDKDEDKKVENLDVDKNEDSDEDKEDEKKNNLEDDKMDIDDEAEGENEVDKNEGNETEVDKDKNAVQEEKEENIENPENKENIDNENNQENPENGDENQDDFFNQDNPDDIPMEIDEENQNQEYNENENESENNLEKEEEMNNPGEDPVEAEEPTDMFKSNPNPTQKEDLGYNPISNNKGSGGNTAQSAKDKNPDEKDNEENEENNRDENTFEDDCEALFDLNSLLDSVWKSRASMRNDKNQKTNRTVDQSESAQNGEENKPEEKDNSNVKDNFDFKNAEGEDEENADPANENNNFDTGYADTNSKNKASGLNNQEENKIKLTDNENKQENENNQQEENENENSPPEIDKIKIEKAKQEDKTKQEKLKQIQEKEQNLNQDIEMNSQNNESENEDEKDQNQELEINLQKLNRENNLENNKKPILEMDREIEPMEIDLQFETPELNSLTNSDFIHEFNAWINNEASSSSLDLWNKLESLSTDLINKLVEHLKIALEPNKQSKLRGNYKSGKRLNIKKIISFIASNYRNDKIWLRRTLPFDRDYFITLAIDDSLSMKEHDLGFFAMESLVIVSSALNKLKVGSLNIVGIKEEMEVLHSGDNFSREKAAWVLSKFKFDFSSRLSHDLAMVNFMKQSIKMCEMQTRDPRAKQIVFVVSDGRFNKDNVKSLCIEAKEKGFLYVFLILDKYGMDNNNSILNMNSVKHVYKADGDYDIEVKPYLEDFPFNYYVIVQHSRDLPEVMNTILVKWFSLVA